ncbi:MAG: hypothetical protein U0Z53_08260 [Blastocatellia bacterium]
MFRRHQPDDRRRKARPAAPARRRPAPGRPVTRAIPDDSGTGDESRYFTRLMEREIELMIVLRAGEQIEGRLAWYDRACLKIVPGDGTPSLIIPRTSIKYLYEV